METLSASGYLGATTILGGLAENDAVTGQMKWFAVRVKANREYVTNASLSGRGYETCLPLYSAGAGDSRRVKPLFPGYVFCRFDGLQRLRVLTSPGVVNIVSFGTLLAPLADEEVAAIQLMVKSGLPVFPLPYLKEGHRIRVTRGSLTGMEGLVTQVRRGWRVVASITLLQRSVAVEVDRSWIEQI